MRDLNNGLIKTPLDPYQTFKDDPLRILRVIRFGVRYQFQFDDAIEESIKNKSIKVVFNLI